AVNDGSSIALGGLIRERGAALILVVWAVGLMAVFAASAARDATLDNADARHYRGIVIAKALAEGGLRYGTKLWRDGDQRIETGTYLCSTETGLLRLDIAPTSIRIDLNRAQEELLENLFVALGADKSTAETAAAYIVDYRDPDSTPRPHGGEKLAYERAGYPSGPRNDAIAHVAELASIPGVPVWLYHAALPHITTHGGSGSADDDMLDPVVQTAYAALSIPVTERRPGVIQSGRINSRMHLRASSSGASANRQGAIRVRAAARENGGGYYVLDTEIAGNATTWSAPKLIRIDTGPVLEGDFTSDDHVPDCGFPALSMAAPR
ncbi:MAG: type II secretion system protein GspK, partial [Henriciella sp.]